MTFGTSIEGTNYHGDEAHQLRGHVYVYETPTRLANRRPSCNGSEVRAMRFQRRATAGSYRTTML